MELRSFKVDRINQGKRLDIFLTSKLKKYSRSSIQKLIKSGQVEINKEVAQKPGLLIEYNDQISIKLPEEKEFQIKPEEIKLDIIYEDKDILVVNKPSGLPTHPDSTYKKGTLVNAILYHLKIRKPKEGRPGIVHRLDKDTSGLLIVAKNRKSQEILKREFKEQKVKKTYLVLVEGIIDVKEGIIDAPIGRSPKKRLKFAVVPEDKGKKAQTYFRVLKYLDNFTLLEVQPKTGRTHQIRVHLSSIHHPVAGDRIYGSKKQKVSLNRQFLHAYKLKFKHPKSGKFVSFKVDLPSDLKSILLSLKEK